MNQTPQPNFETGPPMPEMREGFLSAADIQNLFDDLASCTEVLGIQEKNDRQAHAQAAPRDLPTACRRLIAGDAPAVQVRYRYDGHDWTDTLIRMPQGVRLLRCQHPA